MLYASILEESDIATLQTTTEGHKVVYTVILEFIDSSAMCPALQFSVLNQIMTASL